MSDQCGGRFDVRSGHCDRCAAIDPRRAGLLHVYPGASRRTDEGRPPFTLHYAQHGCHHTLESVSVLALEVEARDMADKGWAHPEKITDVTGRVLDWDAFGVNEPGDKWAADDPNAATAREAGS